MHLTTRAEVSQDAPAASALVPRALRQVLPGTPGFLTRIDIHIAAADGAPITASFALTAQEQEAVERTLEVPLGRGRRLTVTAFNADDLAIFRSAELSIDVQDTTQTVAVTLQRVLVLLPATAATLARRIFVFPESAALHIGPAFGEAALAVGAFTAETAPFALTAGRFATRGTMSLGSCELRVSTNDFPLGESTPQGGQLRLDPCSVDRIDGRLIVQNAATGARSMSRPPVALLGTNDAPSFLKGPNQTVREDAGPQTVPGWATALSIGPPDDTDQTLTFVVTTDTAALFSVPPAIDAITGTLTYTPAPNATGQATVTVRVRDSGGTSDGGVDSSAPQTFLIAVTPVNDAPSVMLGPNQSVLEDAGPQTVPAWATALSPGPSNETSQILTFQVTANTNAGLFAAGPAIDTTGTLTYTPAPQANGTAQLTIIVQDSGGTSDGGVDTSTPQTVTITVAPVNDAPSVTLGANQNVLAEAGPQTVLGWVTTVSAGPPEEAAQTLTFQVTDNSLPGLFVVTPAIASNGTLTYTPAPHANGTAQLTVIVQDSGGTLNSGVDTSQPQTFTITVSSRNDAPSASNQTATTPEDSAVTLTLTASDVDSLSLTFSIVSGPSHGNLGSVSAARCTPSGTGTTCSATVTYTPTAHYNGPDRLFWMVNDGEIATSATASISVTAVNDAPTATSQSETTREDVALALTLRGSDSDSASLTFSLVGHPSHGTLGSLTGTTCSLVANDTGTPGSTCTATVIYTPQPDFNGADSVTFQVNDGALPSASVTMALTVSAVNDAPRFTKGPDQTVLADAGAQSVPHWGTAISAGPSDESAQTLTFVISTDNDTLFSTLPAIALDGTLTYTSAPGQTGVATVTVRLRDNGGTANGGLDTSPAQTLSLTVQPRSFAGVVIVRNVSGPDIGPLGIYLAELGLASRVIDRSVLTFEALRQATLVMWHDGGRARDGLTANDVTVFQSAANVGIPLYFIGDALAQVAQCCLPEPQASTWERLTHLRRADPVTLGPVPISVANTVHPITKGPLGTVGNFMYALNPSPTIRTASGAVLLAQTSGLHDVLLAFEHRVTGVRTVTQNLLTVAGSGPTGVIERKKLFQNAVAWLLRLHAARDADGDGLSDDEENALGTNPHLADTDGDGLLDGVEVNLHGTNPLLADSDGDNFNDGEEINAGSDPLNPASVPGAPRGALVVASPSPRALAIGDINQDGLLDVVVANALDNNVSVFLGVNGGALLHRQDITVETFFSLPSDVALADVNGDGILDLIAIKEQAPDLAVFLGHGDGTFGPMIRIFNSSPGPVRVAVADLDRNGVLDLAIAESRASAVPIFLGNGDGTFLTAPPLEVVTRQLAVAIADLDADGILDVVTGHCDFDVVEQNIVTVVLRNSDGSLRSRSTTRVGECVNSVAVADVNGDGHLDVVSGNRGGSHPPDYGFNISVLLGNGDGTLRHAAVHPSGVGQDTTSIALADVNHDGKPDLVLVNGFDQDGWALLGQGDGTFTIHQHLLLPGEPKAVALADMNGDGHVDMLVANFGAKTLAVWLGQSDGSFLEP